MLSLCDLTKGFVLFDKVETWPNSVITFLESNKRACEDYLNCENEIDERSIEDITLRWNRPSNPFLNKWNSIIDMVEQEIKSEKFVGLHCTRLTEQEIEIIKKNGLLPLSKELINFKLKCLHDWNYISKLEYNYLINNNLSCAENRKNRVWFFLNSKTLEDSSGLHRLFRAWGGESLYWGNESDPNINHTLFRIGSPCIVLGELNLDDINTYPKFARVMVEEYIQKRKDLKRDFDCCVSRKINVIDIIPHVNELFESLTKFSNWNDF